MPVFLRTIKPIFFAFLIFTFFCFFSAKKTFAQQCRGSSTYSVNTCSIDLYQGCIDYTVSTITSGCGPAVGDCGFCRLVSMACNAGGTECLPQDTTGGGPCGGNTAWDTTGCYWWNPINTPIPGVTNPPEPTGPGPTANPTYPPDRWYLKPVSANALIFIDLDRDGNFNPSASNPEKLIYNPGNSTHYSWPGGNGDFSCGTNNNYNTPFDNVSVSFSGGRDDAARPPITGTMEPVCYYHTDGTGTNNGGIYSECGDNQPGQGSPCSGFDLETMKGGNSRFNIDSSARCNWCSVTLDDNAVGGPLFYASGANFPGTPPAGLSNLHAILNNARGQIWMSNVKRNKMFATLNLPNGSGYEITSAKYIQKDPIAAGQPISLFSTCAPPSNCVNINQINFKDWGLIPVKSYIPHYAVAIWGIAPIIPPATCQISATGITAVARGAGILSPYPRYQTLQTNSSGKLTVSSNQNGDLILQKSRTTPPPFYGTEVTPAQFNPKSVADTSFSFSLNPTGIPPGEYIISCSALSFTNLLPNASFEDAITDYNWIVGYATNPVVSTTAPVPDGGKYMTLSGNNSHFPSQWVETNSPLTGETFTLSFWAKSMSTPSTFDTFFQAYPQGTPLLSWTNTLPTINSSNFGGNVPTTWTYYEITGTFDNVIATSQIRAVFNSSVSIALDNVQLRETNIYSETCSGSPWLTPTPGFGETTFCGASSSIVLQVITPTPSPIPGQINVSFINSNSVSDCSGNNPFPANVGGTISTSTTCPGSLPPGRVCNISNQPATTIIDSSIFTLSNLYVNPLAGGSLYSTTINIPGWSQCSPTNNDPFSNTLSLGDFNQNAIFRITKSPGEWYQTLGGSVHFNNFTGNANSITTDFFNTTLGANVDLGLISTNNTGFSCSDLLNASNTIDCHSDPNRDWILTENLITSSAGNPTTYAEFASKITLPNPPNINSASITNGNAPSTDGTYYRDGDLQLNGGSINFGTHKIIIFANGDVNINANITVDTANGGFFAIFANGNIDVDNSVTEIKGIFLTGTAMLKNSFSASGSSASPLNVFGTVIAGNIDNQRTFNPPSTSASLKFNFDPALILNTPDSLKQNASFEWKEVAR